MEPSVEAIKLGWKNLAALKNPEKFINLDKFSFNVPIVNQNDY